MITSFVIPLFCLFTFLFPHHFVKSNINNLYSIYGGQYDTNSNNEKLTLYYKVETAQSNYFEGAESVDNKNFEVFGPFVVQQVRDWWTAGYFDDNLLVCTTLEGDYVNIKSYFSYLDSVGVSQFDSSTMTDNYLYGNSQQQNNNNNLNNYDDTANQYLNDNYNSYFSTETAITTDQYQNSAQYLHSESLDITTNQINNNKKTKFGSILRKISDMGKKAKVSLKQIKSNLPASDFMNSFMQNPFNKLKLGGDSIQSENDQYSNFDNSNNISNEANNYKSNNNVNMDLDTEDDLKFSEDSDLHQEYESHLYSNNPEEYSNTITTTDEIQKRYEGENIVITDEQTISNYDNYATTNFVASSAINNNTAVSSTTSNNNKKANKFDSIDQPNTFEEIYNNNNEDNKKDKISVNSIGRINLDMWEESERSPYVFDLTDSTDNLMINYNLVQQIYVILKLTAMKIYEKLLLSVSIFFPKQIILYFQYLRLMVGIAPLRIPFLILSGIKMLRNLVLLLELSLLSNLMSKYNYNILSLVFKSGLNSEFKIDMDKVNIFANEGIDIKTDLLGPDLFSSKATKDKMDNIKNINKLIKKVFLQKKPLLPKLKKIISYILLVSKDIVSLNLNNASIRLKALYDSLLKVSVDNPLILSCGVVGLVLLLINNLLVPLCNNYFNSINPMINGDNLITDHNVKVRDTEGGIFPRNQYFVKFISTISSLIFTIWSVSIGLSLFQTSNLNNNKSIEIVDISILVARSISNVLKIILVAICSHLYLLNYPLEVKSNNKSQKFEINENNKKNKMKSSQKYEYEKLISVINSFNLRNIFWTGLIIINIFISFQNINNSNSSLFYNKSILSNMKKIVLNNYRKWNANSIGMIIIKFIRNLLYIMTQSLEMIMGFKLNIKSSLLYDSSLDSFLSLSNSNKFLIVNSIVILPLVLWMVVNNIFARQISSVVDIVNIESVFKDRIFN